MIYSFSVRHFLQPSKARSRQSKDDRVLMAAIGDTNRFTFQSSLLRTCRQVLREAVPIYQKVIQTEVVQTGIKLLNHALEDRILNKQGKPDGWSTPSHPEREGGALHVRYLEDIDAFANEVKGLEDWLKAWKGIEKMISMGGVAKEEVL